MFLSRELKEGDTIWHDGTRYRVLSIAQTTGSRRT
jgi:translation elongation factor P/translation initiation factor 5A